MSRDNEESGVWRYINGHRVFIKNKVPKDTLRDAIQEYYANKENKEYHLKYCTDSMDRWVVTKNSKYQKAEKLPIIDGEFEFMGEKYKYIPRTNYFDHKPEEIDILNNIAKNYGIKVQLIPKINIPKGISTPDAFFIWRNGIPERWDLKRITGSGKNTLLNAVLRKGNQSNKFLYYIKPECSFSNYEIMRQVDDIFRYPHTQFIDEIAVMRGEKIEIALKKK